MMSTQLNLILIGTRVFSSLACFALCTSCTGIQIQPHRMQNNKHESYRYSLFGAQILVSILIISMPTRKLLMIQMLLFNCLKCYIVLNTGTVILQSFNISYIYPGKQRHHTIHPKHHPLHIQCTNNECQ